MPSISVGGININVPDNVNVGGGSGGAVNVGGSGSPNAHIGAQNAAGQELSRLVFAYQQLPANAKTVANIQPLVNQVNNAVAQFAAVVVDSGNTARGRQGLADIRRLADDVIRSFVVNTGEVFTPQGTVISPNGGGALSNMLGGMDTSTMLLLGVGAYFLFKKR